MGAWSLALLLAYPIMILVLRRAALPAEPRQQATGSLRGLAWRTAAAAAVILAAGACLVFLADELTARWSLEASFVGASAVAISTSLPELSTTLTAARMGRPTLAFSNILGTNLLEVTLLGGVDAITPGPPILDEAGSASVALVLLGILLTMLYVAGALWRRQPTLGRLSLDSWAVAACYLGFMVWLGAR